MLLYIAAGIYNVGGNPAPAPVLAVPPERVIRLTKNSAFVTAAFSIDPTDQLNFEIDLTALLEADEEFSTVALNLLPASTALGFSIPETGAQGIAEIAPGRLQFWPLVESMEQNRSAWAGGGTQCGFEITALTNQGPRRWQRTIYIRVVQK